MNCLFLVLLLLCCGNDNGCGCFGCRNAAERGCGSDCRDGRDRNRDRDCDRGRDRDEGCGCNDRDRDRNDGCGCNDRDRDRNDGCGRRNDDCMDSRSESRSFIPYPGPSNGRGESENRGGCNCAD